MNVHIFQKPTHQIYKKFELLKLLKLKSGKSKIIIQFYVIEKGINRVSKKKEKGIDSELSKSIQILPQQKKMKRIKNSVIDYSSWKN